MSRQRIWSTYKNFSRQLRRRHRNTPTSQTWRNWIPSATIVTFNLRWTKHASAINRRYAPCGVTFYSLRQIKGKQNPGETNYSTIVTIGRGLMMARNQITYAYGTRDWNYVQMDARSSSNLRTTNPVFKTLEMITHAYQRIAQRICYISVRHLFSLFDWKHCFSQRENGTDDD